ncbi:MAG: deoxyribose-phosphate aldolase [Flexilinea sp.]
MIKCTSHDIAKMIDHSLLNPTFTKQDIIAGCEIAKKYDTATVCVKPCDVDTAMTILRDTDVLVTTVIGFPHGSNLTSVKVFEAEKAIAQGCKELDMVLNIGRLLGGDYEYVEQDIKAVCDTGHASNIIVKVILENAYLTPELIAVACKISEKAGADFVKTSTGYAPSGATISDLKIMRASTSPKVRIKAAGGVRSLNAALAVRAVGGSRFGCTRTAEIIEDAKKREAEGTLVLPEDPQSF